MRRSWGRGLVFSVFALALGAPLGSQVRAAGLEFPTCSPATDPSGFDNEGASLLDDGGKGRPAPSLSFCSDWNPEFPYNGFRCCTLPKAQRGRRRRRSRSHICLGPRAHPSFCEDMTPEQRDYVAALNGGRIADPLPLISSDMGKRGPQSYCSVSDGFLAWGRPVVPSALNHILLRRPSRCSNFATDPMAGLLEWTGQQVARQYASQPEYAGVHLVLGDVSAPKGGCLSGILGSHGHLSHTTGQDADVGFLWVQKNRPSPLDFHTSFDPKVSWWLIKQVFHNPFACVKVIFLDKRLIRKLGRAARGDPEWSQLGRFIRHMPGHRNHMHVRVGDGPGVPGCGPNAHPELEEEDDGETMDSPDYQEPNGAVELENISSKLDAPASAADGGGVRRPSASQGAGVNQGQ